MSKRRGVVLVAYLQLFIVTDSVRAETKIDAYYRADFLYNTAGGIDTGGAYIDDAALTVDADLSDLLNVADARFFVFLLWNNGNTFSDLYVGDVQGISNIDTIEALRVYEFWYEQPLSTAVTLRFGLYDLNSEFDAIGTSGFFINSSHGMGSDYAQSGQAGPSIFPVTSLAARLDWAISESSTIRYALLDGVPGDPDDPARTAIELGDGDGVLHALEYNRETAGGTRFGVGTWRYSEEFDRIDGNGQDDGNAGYYGFVDTSLRSADVHGYGLTAYLRYGIAEDVLNMLDSYAGAGIVATGLIDSRPDDQIGFAIARAGIGDTFRRAAEAAGSPANDHETNFEFGYGARLSDWLRLQPYVQYVMNPGADRSLDDAFVIGLRFEMAVSNR